MKTPSVSIIMPAYNAERFVIQAIQSIVAQTYTDYELLLINDGSTDTTEQVIFTYIEELKKNNPELATKITYIKNEKNLQLIATLNKGISLAQGTFIGRIDADDIWTSRLKLEKQVMFLEKNLDHALVGTFAYVINEQGDVTSSLSYPTNNSQIRRELLTHSCFIHPSVLMRKDAVIACGQYDINEKHVEDYGLWLRIGKKYKFANIGEYLMSYRVVATGVSQSNKILHLTQAIMVVKKHHKTYPNFLFALCKWYIQLLIRKFKHKN